MSSEESHRRRYEDLLPAYAIGALEGEELRELERHLAAGCARCERELSEWGSELETLAASVEPVAPSDTTRARVLKAIAAGEQEIPDSGQPAWLAKIAVAAAIALLAVGAWSHLELRSELSRLRTELATARQDLGATRVELTAAHDELAAILAANRIMASPAMTAVELASEARATSSARCYVDRSGGRAVVYFYSLEPLPVEKTYQLWSIPSGGRAPVSAGVFEIDADGNSTHFVELATPVDEIEAWAVSVEPAGGVEQPTGEIVLVGTA